MMTYIDMCSSGAADPVNWKKWLSDFPGKEPVNERLGLLPEEYEDLNDGMRSMDFYVFKRKHVRSIYKIWPGCYVKYLYEYDLHEPHFEYGWVDVVNNERGFCKIQCDDSFNGNRAVAVRTIDVMEILPFKERPLVFYKTMICGDCNGCDRTSNDVPMQNCKAFAFMNAILSKQKGDAAFIRLLYGIPEPDPGSPDAEVPNE